MHHLFGIRHHGPGSARCLLKAFDALQPDALLVEAPADAERLLPQLTLEGLRPPIAMLIYNKNNLQQAAYFPFASFSPEWQAIQWAFAKKIPVRFIDLPYTLQFALDAATTDSTQLSFDTPVQKKLYHHDPMAHLAQLAGYTDQERWWEVTFEENDNPENIFPIIVELMISLRQNEPTPNRELRREAFMRKSIRTAIKEGFGNIAVVCGAWHTPALADLKAYKSTHDNTLLRGIKKVTTAHTLIPWSYERLSLDSGYLAGTLAPSWYDLLFRDRSSAPVRWMTQAAFLLRQQDIPTSSAHIIEAVRLANSLAGLRNLPLAGIRELEQAAISVFCDGYTAQMDLIYKALMYGDNFGEVPPSIPVVPLQKDFEKWVKSTRLTKYKNSSTEEWLKATASNPRGGIDLRDPADHRKSLLLHRLGLLGIHWGRLQPVPPTNTGRFKEYWKLKWLPDFAIHLIEAGMWGNTVEEAAVAKIKNELQSTIPLPELSRLIDISLKADLNDLLPNLVAQLQDATARTRDVLHLMEALSPLVRALRYGNARQLNVTALQQVVLEMIPRICVALPGATTGIDEEAAEKLLDQITTTNRNIHLLETDALPEGWYGALYQISELNAAQPQLQGVSTRILFDRSVKDVDEVATQMFYALSQGNTAQAAAQWLQGFLHGSGLLLIHHPALWQILDGWVEQIPMDKLQDLLPLLRRTFSAFPGPERQKILQMVMQGVSRRKTGTSHGEELLHTSRTKGVMEVVDILLGK